MRVRLALIELVLLASALGCQQPTKEKQTPRAGPSAPTELTRLLAPRQASRFRERAGKQRQEHPRLPDTGEWRCAERERVVWCAGGESAAGIVAGPPDRGYRCGERWGQHGGERVCIDTRPDYPGEGYQCRFEQERGIARVCELATAVPGPGLMANALSACWLDRDCPSGRCDRGTCSCSATEQCLRGTCQSGVCSEGKP
jgi:hypothetical protein